MSRLRRLVRQRLDVHFCDGCARVETCDATCYTERARQSATVRALTLGIRF